DVTGEDFQAIQGIRVATGLSFLPSSFLSNETFRLSLVVKNGALIFTDSSEQPLKKLMLSDATVSPLAARFNGAQGVALRGTNAFWVSGNQLSETALAGATTVLSHGTRDPNSKITTDIVADDTSVYWALTDTSSGCSPACNDLIQRVPLDGSAPVTLAVADRRIVALTGDTDHIYWEEEMMEPVSPGCHCGSTIKSIPKAGGTIVVLVDGSLNGTLPNPGPGYTPGSWFTTGGLAVTATQVVFGFSAGPDQLKSVGLQGGAVTTLATGGTIKSIRADGTSAYWIDKAAGTLDSVPLAGGSVATLASGLGSAVSLRVTASRVLFSDAGPPSGCCLQTGMGSLKAVPLGGGVVSTVVAGLDAPAALDADAGNLVWTELWRVGAAPAAGSPVTTLASGIANSLTRIAADQNNLYILDGELIKAVPLAGGKVERLTAAIAVIGNPGPGPVNVNGDIVTDGTNVYWTADETGLTVQSVPVTGGAPVTLAVDALDTSAQPCYWRIAVDAQNVYWTSSETTSPVGCSVKKVPLNGGAATTVVDYPYLRDFTVDGGNVYFSELGGRTLQKIGIDGGPATLVVSAVSPWVLVSGAGRLFWLEPKGLGVSFVSEAGGTPVPMGGALSDPALVTDALAVDQTGVYCAEGQAGLIDFMH
ncbi:MAG TPA: hypothetical protein VKB20_05050, partial [Steroidobacteraceae bacterium]|nr:hypothetical protein [Steroidobacteraceae bacterium]